MLAHGIQTEHIVAMMSGSIGSFGGFAAIYVVWCGKRYWEYLTGMTFGCSASAFICGVLKYGELSNASGWEYALRSTDFRICYVPPLVLGSVAFLFGVTGSIIRRFKRW